MEVEVRNAQRKFRVDRLRLAGLAGRALEMLGLDDAQLSVLVVNDRRMREFNRTYRRIDRPTDVLAFSQREGGGPDLHPGVLGDVVLCAPAAARQAPRTGWSLERELDLLLVHGILHLAGFDHTGTSREKARMDTWKRRILRGWKR